MNYKSHLSSLWTNWLALFLFNLTIYFLIFTELLAKSSSCLYHILIVFHSCEPVTDIYGFVKNVQIITCFGHFLKFWCNQECVWSFRRNFIFVRSITFSKQNAILTVGKMQRILLLILFNIVGYFAWYCNYHFGNFWYFQ